MVLSDVRIYENRGTTTTTATEDVASEALASSKRRRNVRRKALIVGINEYQNPNNNLQGCVPDAQDMAATLRMLGFPASKQRLLINEQASTDGILAGLDWLTKDMASGDVCIFYYSGHGSQVADLNNEETDRLDEIICPWDISWNGRKYITDDQLYDYFSKKVSAGVRTDVVLDSCFSGSATRSFNLNSTLYNRKQRYLPPPVNHRSRINSMIPTFSERLMFGARSVFGPDIVKQNNVLWSGCQEDQVSWEMVLGGSGNQVRGAFTYYLCSILREFQGNASRREIYTLMRDRMNQEGFEQIPNLEGPSAEILDIFPFRKASEIDQASEMKKR